MNENQILLYGGLDVELKIQDKKHYLCWLGTYKYKNGRNRISWEQIEPPSIQSDSIQIDSGDIEMIASETWPGPNHYVVP